MLMSCREAFAAWLPPLGVPLSYAIAISYVLVDTYDKGQRAYKSADRELGSRASLHPEVNTNRCAVQGLTLSPKSLTLNPNPQVQLQLVSMALALSAHTPGCNLVSALKVHFGVQN